jgi:5'-deoxynucleotidase YfbR-like HD superfamily hydrolase
MDKNIYNLTNEAIQDLSFINIKTADGIINVIDEFKKIPRSGKSVRIDKYNIKLPKQSLLDHVFQTALIADLITVKLNIQVNKQTLAYMIACHDLPEVVTGDIPNFTEDSLSFQKNNGDLKKEEKETAKLITQQLLGKLKENIEFAFDNLDGSTFESKIFNLSDKIEPIVSVWRYLFFYKNQIELDVYLEAMNDFFVNPKVINFSINEETLQLINCLQSKEKAEAYFNDNSINFELNLFTNSDIKKIIEYRNIDSI